MKDRVVRHEAGLLFVESKKNRALCLDRLGRWGPSVRLDQSVRQGPEHTRWGLGSAASDRSQGLEHW